MTMPTRADDIAAIKQLARDWQAGWLAGDADALVSLYADAPVLIPQNSPPIVGKDAIRATYQSVFKDYTIKGGGEILEIEAAGDWAYFWSTYAITATPKSGGEPVQDTGNSIFILKRERDSTWKIARLISNSDRSAPGG